MAASRSSGPGNPARTRGRRLEIGVRKIQACEPEPATVVDFDPVVHGELLRRLLARISARYALGDQFADASLNRSGQTAAEFGLWQEVHVSSPTGLYL